MKLYCWFVLEKDSMRIDTDGFTCEASTTFNSSYDCRHVLDSDKMTEWMPDPNIGAWIEIQFHNFYALSKVKFHHVLGVRQNCGPFLNIQLIFSDGRGQEVTLPTSAQSNTVEITGNNQTEYLLVLTSQQNCKSGNSGFSEIQLYGHKVDGKLDR